MLSFSPIASPIPCSLSRTKAGDRRPCNRYAVTGLNIYIEEWRVLIGYFRPQHSASVPPSPFKFPGWKTGGAHLNRDGFNLV
jgi:hypothetical protein